jgi:hypothetical protein
MFGEKKDHILLFYLLKYAPEYFTYDVIKKIADYTRGISVTATDLSLLLDMVQQSGTNSTILGAFDEILRHLPYELSIWLCNERVDLLNYSPDIIQLLNNILQNHPGKLSSTAYYTPELTEKTFTLLPSSEQANGYTQTQKPDTPSPTPELQPAQSLPYFLSPRPQFSLQCQPQPQWQQQMVPEADFSSPLPASTLPVSVLEQRVLEGIQPPQSFLDARGARFFQQLQQSAAVLPTIMSQPDQLQPYPVAWQPIQSPLPPIVVQVQPQFYPPQPAIFPLQEFQQQPQEQTSQNGMGSQLV